MPSPRCPALLVIGLGLTLGLASCSSKLEGASAARDGTTLPAAPIPPQPPVYETITLPTAIVHWVTIPDPVNYPVRVAVSDSLDRVDYLAAQVCETEGCVAAALNAGFFDPNNGLTTSYVVVDGGLVADPNQNTRLIGNPDLAPYLDKILNRSEFRRYDCGGIPRYGITAHQEPAPSGCVVVDAVGAGPQLLPEDTSGAEGFLDPTMTPVRDALGRQFPNARSAIGLKADGSLVLVMVAQIPGMSPSGMTLPELAAFMGDRGVVQALNLDGGSSSTLVYGGTTYYGRLNQAGDRVQRPVKSIFWVESQ